GEIQSIRVQKNDYPFILEELAVHEDELIVQKPSPFSYEYEGFMRAFKTSLMINEWISERGEDLLLEEYGIPPGSLHQLLANLEWILYSIGEIADVKQVKGVKEFTNGLILRVKYGVKSDLLTLVSLRGIGRVRARKLYINGFKTVSELRSAGIEKISKIIGPNTARKLIDSLDP
ncbi:MAG TPA: helix-hairpin-helix domain-containing protein, partial [Candidatus Nanoarchaeia archaeon]|nr:helix-hairpin-helix domain-containing protein [Candidatus Nanoarchaeia archaeon]